MKSRTRFTKSASCLEIYHSTIVYTHTHTQKLIICNYLGYKAFKK